MLYCRVSQHFANIIVQAPGLEHSRISLGRANFIMNTDIIFDDGAVRTTKCKMQKYRSMSHHADIIRFLGFCLFFRRRCFTSYHSLFFSRELRRFTINIISPMPATGYLIRIR